MKKVFFLVVVGFAMTTTKAQNIVDGLRYSTENMTGSARFSSMSGAFGALGGDLSAISINPAGSAVFLSSTASVSFSVENTKNDARYFDNSTSEKFSDFVMNQAGVVFVFDSYNEDAAMKKFTLGLNYDLMNNFDNSFRAGGRSNTSIDQYFLGYADGIALELLQTLPGESISSLYRYLGENYGYGAQQAFLGYQSYIINPSDPDNPNNTGYYSAIAPGVFEQDFSSVTSGFNAKYSINAAAQIGYDWYVGVNFNSYIIDYLQTTRFYETNNNSGSVVNRVFFENNLAVLGSGFSMQLGAITKVSDNLRLGLTYDTPTWFRISEETSQHIETRRVENGNTINQIVSPNVVNIYDDYRLKAPGKITTSAAYIFEGYGLISVDYSYRNFSNMEFRPVNDAYFSAENARIEDMLKAVSSVRIGGEYRLYQLNFRAGFRYEQSPYDDTSLMSDLTGFSFGIGYSFGNTRLDVAYINTRQERNHQLLGGAFTNAANINAVNNNIVFTLSSSL